MDVSKAIEIAGRMLIRRSRTLEAEDQNLLRYAARNRPRTGLLTDANNGSTILRR
ncbi:MAG: hypothetical protein KatS3mg104_0758 [Phycisphaerae bacterium]|nr:MAG: hypothetical protein KatS3mg104_0758 [Phycisphaerae bacterium]